MLLALEVFQENPSDFYPYRSRYDAWLRGKGGLSTQEERGMAAFNDPRRGNCASCHPSLIRNGAFPQFTDFGYAALAVPRNARIPANQDSTFRDLGLCGPLRTDLATRKEYCGFFRVPSLRNVALRRAFFHNGVVHTLGKAVAFYARRDTHPGEWYPRRVGGGVEAYDDLPPELRGNVNREPPFDRPKGSKAALSASEIKDVVAFLHTLTDEDLLPR